MCKLRKRALRTGCTLVGAGLLLLQGQQSVAGTFNSDFNTGLPVGMTPFGPATTVDTGGVGNSGYFRLTEAASSSGNSGAIIDDFDAGAAVAGFDVTFDLYIGSGNGADGFSFVFGDFADGATWAEEGPGTIRGLTITWDSYNNGGTPAEAPAIDLKWNNNILFHRLVGATGTTTPASPIGTATTVRTQPTTGGAAVWWPVKIHVDPDGTLDLVYNNVIIFTNVPVMKPFDPAMDPPLNGSAYRFGFGARTGGSYDVHAIDNLNITTVAPTANSGQPSLTTVSPQPVGLNAGAAGGVEVVFTNNAFAIDTTKVTMRYGNNNVTPTVTQLDGSTRIAYRGNNGVLATGAATVTVGYATTSGFTNYFSFNFVVDPFTTLATNIALASVDTSKPGFNVRVHQFDTIRAPSQDQNQIILAERQLAQGYLDPATGLPYPNTADLTLADPNGLFVVTGVINYNYQAPTAIGNFSANSNPVREDQQFPGMPGSGSAEAGFANVVSEFTTILELKQGGNRFGVNSDDGFRVSFGPGYDAAGTIVGSFNGGRGTADTLFDIVVPADGFYPIRLTHWQGGGGFNLEFFWIDPATGAKVLVNDPDNPNAPRAYRDSAVSRPSVTRVLPVQNDIGVFADEDVVIDITDGALTLDANSVKLFINNTAQAVTSGKSGKVTTIRRQSSISNLLPSGLNTVRLEYGYTESGTPVTRTNTYTFNVAPYYGVLQPGSRVTGASEPGFRVFADQMDRSLNSNQGEGGRISAGGDANRMPWPEVHLSGNTINPTNGLRYPNLATASSPDNWNYDVEWINWAFNAEAAQPTDSGWFRPSSPAAPLLGAHDDLPVPGLPGAGTSPAPTSTSRNYQGLENAVFEITTYLELTRGVHVFGFNSDDGFIAINAPDVHDTLGTLMGFFSGGRGVTANMVVPSGQNPPTYGTTWATAGSTLFNVIVPEDGIYPVRILYWQGGTGIGAEFFSINRTNRAFVLVGDTASGGIPAYKTYNGPARPYVKFSVSPTPWDNAVQQVGPGPIRMIGRTRQNANAADIHNIYSSAVAPRPWADVGIGAVFGNGTSAGDIRLLLDGAEVPLTSTTNGTDVTVVYKPNPPLPSGSSHTASLVYAGTTNSWSFVVQRYTNLPAADALPASAADPNSRGFRVKMAKTASITGFTQSSVARAEAQLAGILSPNVATPGPGPDGSYIYTNVINWTNNISPGWPQGNFVAPGYYGAATGWPYGFYAEEPVPGVPGSTAGYDNFAAEIFAYWEFPTNGYYKIGINSDDGFALKIGTPGVTNGTVIASYDLGKGSSDIPVSFVVNQPGLYPIRLVWYNSGGGTSLEFFSYTENGGKIPINALDNPGAIKTYYALATVTRPEITSATSANGNITIIWVNGGTLESAQSLDGPWTSTGDSDGSFTEPATAAMKFYRVKQ